MNDSHKCKSKKENKCERKYKHIEMIDTNEKANINAKVIKLVNANLQWKCRDQCS